MLTLKSLTVENFGPFKDKQTITFPADGVAIVYGENGRGKTFLLNAIRYALFKKVLSRGSRKISLPLIGNWESALAGTYGFKVIMAFEQDGKLYELTRQYKAKNGATKPENDADYVEECYLRRDRKVLSSDERDAELAKVMPEQVSRFFLFDGELLQEYEELLIDESEMGDKIKDAIERILGVPVLINARTDFRELQKEYQRRESKAAQDDEKTRALGNIYADLTDQRVHHEKEVARLKTDLTRLKEARNGLESSLKRNERIRFLLDEKDRLEKEVKGIDGRIGEKEDLLKDKMGGVWRTMLNSKINSIREKVDRDILEIQSRGAKKVLDREKLAMMKQAVRDHICPVCTQPIGADIAAHLNEKFTDIGAKPEDSGDNEKLGGLIQLSVQLKKYQPTVSSDMIIQLLHDIDEFRIDKAAKQDRITEITDQAGDAPQSQIRKDVVQYEETVKEISIVERGIRDEGAEIEKINVQIDDIRKKLYKSGMTNLDDERRRTQLCNQLFDLFSDGVTTYREKLRARVEKDATELFRRLTTEPDYAGLDINKNYGLTITHKDGQKIPIRSAGVEHIVALSLMGALHRNAPLQGPIIMDSPLGRLDEGHTKNVVQALPSMADQVLLLVYESELKPQMARDELLGNLKTEYKMARESARHTTLVKNRGE